MQCHLWFQFQFPPSALSAPCGLFVETSLCCNAHFAERIRLKWPQKCSYTRPYLQWFECVWSCSPLPLCADSLVACPYEELAGVSVCKITIAELVPTAVGWYITSLAVLCWCVLDALWRDLYQESRHHTHTADSEQEAQSLSNLLLLAISMSTGS